MFNKIYRINKLEFFKREYFRVILLFLVLEISTILFILILFFPSSFKPVIQNITKKESFYTIGVQEYKILRDKNTAFSTHIVNVENFCSNKKYPNSNYLYQYWNNLFISTDQTKGQITANCYSHSF